MISPDGHWLTYYSNESGRNEVYVRPFPGPGGKWQISTGSGTSPVWSHKSPELFYQNNEGIMVASYTTKGEAFVAEQTAAVGREEGPGPGRVFRSGAGRQALRGGAS